ncbi:hypothetical protein PG985_011983 [Apiospora marii]|uniref:Uncharacterized protein n=1 Tax=Apiospora marii TaxID=335849 RepID=A0ABR1REM3_9PEZI
MAFILGLVGRAIRDAATSDERDTFSPHDTRTRHHGHNNHQAYPGQYQQPYPPCQQPQQAQYAPSPPFLPFGRGQPGLGPMTKRERRGCRRAERQCRRSQRHYCSGPSSLPEVAPSSSYPPYRTEEAWAAPQGPFASRREGSGRELAYNANNNREAGPSSRPQIPDDTHHSGRRRYSDETASTGEEEELPPAYEDVVAGTRSRPGETALPSYGRKGQ